MNEKTNGNSANNRDYNFWRSQHRPKSSTERSRSASDTLVDAIANRFGEELGSHSHDLFWDAFPNAMKKSIGFGLGKVVPVIVAGGHLKNLLKKKSDSKETLPRLAFESLLASVDGSQASKGYKSLQDLYQALNLAEGYWQIHSLWNPSICLRWVAGNDATAAKLSAHDNSGVIFSIEDPNLLQCHTAIRNFVRKLVIDLCLGHFHIDSETKLEELKPEQVQALAAIMATCQTI